ncbi:alpha/beta fold hydrolase [Streptomyces physcomitrii]|uniref:Alpha/beta hydrolase n=1 Tax=Streptomyces physcomitrii TaxID=2724184 RepID=A0ABX1H133_9ACTN|nr:alpha/beta hydrolase [Streptomyces physcomitrii]NKI41753.1 alpha/beta hydrolase [Streptomyces physcomitrii]
MSSTTSAAGHVQGRSEWVPTRDGRRLHAMVLPGPGADTGSEGENDGKSEGEEAGGTGAPTVVFEAGAAATRSSWALVQPAVGKWARAVVYDRSGLGRSPVDPDSRTMRRMADDLQDLLDHFGPGPYVLVGHSAGGPLVRLAAAGRLDRIRGLVLVDPTDEGAELLFGATFRRAERVAIAINLLLARLRLLGVAYGFVAKPLPEDARRDIRSDGFSVDVIRTHRAQARTFLDELRQFRDAPPELGDIPVTVVSGGLTGAGMNQTTRRAANEAHARNAERSPRGKHVIAARSGHYVTLTEPDLVAEEIRLIADQRPDRAIRPLADPHTAIDPATIRPGDHWP